MAATKYTREALVAAVEQSQSLTNVMRLLGLPIVGGNWTHIKNRITAEGIDTSHFLGQAHNRGKKSMQFRTPESILVMGSPQEKRTRREYLVRSMIASGFTEVCTECGVGNTYNGKNLVLEVDHIDGQHWNNLIENLRFLCPNCHSQQPTNRSWKNKPL